MTKPPTAAEALAMARQIIDDHDNPLLGPGYVSSDDREDRLARFVEAVLTARSTPLRVNAGEGKGRGIVIISEHAPKMDGSDVLARLSPDQARATAAALLRAADEAEETP